MRGQDPRGAATHSSSGTGRQEGGRGVSAPQTFTITVDAVNDPPANAVPGPLMTNEDAAVAFSGANALSVSDADAGTAVLLGNGGNDTVTLSRLPLGGEYYGGEGNDYLAGGNLADTLDGGDGTDRHLGATSGDLIFGGNIDDFAAQDPFTIALLWSALNSGDSDAAFDSLELDFAATDDSFSDNLHGETDADWYLAFLSTDRFQAATEKNSPNKFWNLS